MTQPSWIGQTLGGRYLIEDELGQGGMSAVYRAGDPNLRRVVAIKLIHSHLSRDPEFVRRFEAEATVVAQLRHPNIIQVYDFNHDGDTYYIVFEFVPGETLQQRLKRLSAANRQMAMADVLKFALSIGDALVYAHERNIIHRDIKPANVLINVQDEAILTDFGIVKIIGGTQHTATGAVLGTARYMSPEQIRGKKVEAPSDIYSLGVMLYEMVSGRPPFNADSVMTLMMMHVTDPVPDMRNIRPDVPDGLARVINKALVKEPEQRYQTMAEVVADLRRIQAGGEAKSATNTVTEANMTMLDSDLTELLESDMDDYNEPAPRSTPPISAPKPAPRPAPSPVRTTSSAKSNRNLYIGLGIVVVLAVIAVLYFIFQPTGNDGDLIETPGIAVVESPEATAVPEIAPPPDTATPPPSDTPESATATPTATIEATATATLPPTATNPPPTATNPPPTATSPPPTAVTQLSVRINGISIDGDRYVVSYETFGYTETLPGTHIHFFFNTVPPAQAGVPGSGPWILYGGPRPFTGYGVNDRGSASQMCALVANPDHSVIANSGNCMNLP